VLESKATNSLDWELPMVKTVWVDHKLSAVVLESP